MLKKLLKLWQLFYNYGICRLFKKPSTAYFWYLPCKAAIYDKHSLATYQDPQQSSMPYVINYQAKLNYNLTNTAGIIVLPYEAPVGTQVNPEAAFQYALALHDRYLAEKNPQDLAQFLHYADYFQKLQNNEGDWLYEFNWFESKAPWASPLAQSRGASVMLRAWRLSQEIRYLTAAQQALQKFFLNQEDGGYLYKLNTISYFEEYPASPSCALNGHMAALFSLWEYGYWQKDTRYQHAFNQGLKALIALLPRFTLKNWTLYDLHPHKKLNVNSTYYHRLEIIYLQVFNVLTHDKDIRYYLKKRQAQDTFFNRCQACLKKLIIKLTEHHANS